MTIRREGEKKGEVIQAVRKTLFQETLMVKGTHG